MKKVVLAFTLSAAFGFLFFNRVVKAQLETSDIGQKVIAQEPTGTPAPTETPTPKPTPKTLRSSKPTAKAATPTPVPQPTFTHEQIYGFTERFGSQYGVDPNVLRYIALCESEFRPGARNGPYYGLYQFGAVTWSNFRKQMHEDPSPDLRTNAEEAVQTAAYALSLGKRGIWPNCYPK